MKDKFNQHKERLRYFRQINRQAMMMKAVKGIQDHPQNSPNAVLQGIDMSPQLMKAGFAL